MTRALAVNVTDLASVAEARGAAGEAAAEAGFGEIDAGRVAIVASELATNLAKHAGGGTLVVQVAATTAGPAVELVSIDRGPGLRREVVFADGFSTTGTLGTGLGAVHRLSDECDLYSVAAGGTVLVARLHPRPGGRPVAVPPARVGGVRLPAPGEVACGDAWEARESAGEVVVLVSDGLGHGEGAAQASEAATAVLRSHASLPPEQVLEAVHAALRPTRGAAVGVARMDSAAGTVTYAAVGNIGAAVVAPPGMRRLVSQHGIAGHNAGRVRALTYPCPPGAVLVLHTDGISAHWDLGPYPGLATRHPTVIAGWLVTKFRRCTDDACAVAVRQPEGGR